jgi:hypothetical protein
LKPDAKLRRYFGGGSVEVKILMKGSQKSEHGSGASLILEAVERVGCDGKGRDGLIGFLQSLAKNHPRQYIALLAKAVDQEPPKEVAPESFRTQAEVEAEMKKRGLPIPKEMFY